MKLSVIVPVYNMAADDKLTWCIDSLVAQTIFRNAEAAMEIIAVDDASTDNSPELLDSYAERFPKRFRVVHSHRNLHQGGAKNIGLTIAKGEWIGFIDADDWVTPDFYETLLAAAESEGADMAGCDYSLVNGHTWEVTSPVSCNSENQTGLLTADRHRALILDPGSLVIKVYRREILLGDAQPAEDAEEALKDGHRLAVFPEHIFYEDNAVAALFMSRAHAFAYVPKPMYYYLQHTASTVHTIGNEHLKDRMTAARRMLALMKEEGVFDTYRTELEYAFTRLFYINTLFSAMPSGSRVKGKYTLTKALGAEMRQTFPAFMENPYYLARTDGEERRLIAMQMRSHLMFYLYYRLLWTYRGWKSALRHGRDDETV